MTTMLALQAMHYLTLDSPVIYAGVYDGRHTVYFTDMHPLQVHEEDLKPYYITENDALYTGHVLRTKGPTKASVNAALAEARQHLADRTIHIGEHRHAYDESLAYRHSSHR